MTISGQTFDARKNTPRAGAKSKAMMRHARALAAGAGASSDGQHSRAYELLLTWVDGAAKLSFATPVFAVLAALVSLSWAERTHALIWLMLILAANGVVYSLCRSFRNKAAETIKIQRWIGLFAAAEFFHAASWAYGMMSFWSAADDIERGFLIGVQIIILATRTANNAMILAVARTAAATVCLTVIASCLTTDGKTYLMIAAFMMIYGFYVVKRAERKHREAIDVFSFRAENNALIAELEQARNNSDGARRRAEDANIAKSRFLATMSHELRTPLNAIIGFSEIMKNEMLGAHQVPAYKEYSNDVFTSGQHLLNLINEILDLSRIEAGRYDLNETAISIETIGTECGKLLNLRAEERGVTLNTQFETDLPVVYADERAIRQIWLNLISNAIKFTPRDGMVTLRGARNTHGGVVFSVRDTGPGIPENEIPIVLSAFGQGSLAQEKAEEGAGLGLAIVQGLIKLHEGTFSLSSKLRVGTEAIFSLPSDRVLQSGQAADEDTNVAVA